MNIWYNSNWTHRQKLTVDHQYVLADLTDYVLYVNENGFSKTGTSNDIFDNSRADGFDIVVTTSDGSTKLDAELVNYDPTAKTLELYVKIPLLSSTVDTDIYVYYGYLSHIEAPSTSVWSNYQHVSHNGGSHNSKTGGSGTGYGTTAIISGLAGKALSLPNAGSVMDSGFTHITYPMTFQAMIKPSTSSDGDVLGQWNNTANDFYLTHVSGNWNFIVDSGGGSIGAGTVQTNAWNLLSLSINSTSAISYLGGVLQTTVSSGGATGAIDSGATLKFNDRGDFNHSTGGYAFDEIRVATSVLPATYISTEANNFTNTVFVISSEQEVFGSYNDVNLATVVFEQLPVTLNISINIIEDTVSTVQFLWDTGVVNSGINLYMNEAIIVVESSIVSVQASSEIFGLNIVLDPFKALGGARKFRPTKRLEIFKEENHQSNKDSRFISGIVRENVNMGGVVCYVWLITGTFEQTDKAGNVGTQLDEKFGEPKHGLMHFLDVQDSILGENRDRSYAEDAVRIKGTYAVSQNELDFARFGIMLNNDVIQIEFHKEEMETLCGRRMIPGDVIEMPHLREVGLLNSVSNRFYQVESVTRAPNGFDFTYNYHILAVTMRPVVDAQEFIDLMERTDEYGVPIGDQLSDRKDSEAWTERIQEIATDQVYTTGWDLTALYIDDEDNVFSHRYSGDGVPPNGKPVQSLTYFPSNPAEGDYVCRIDNFPNRLYRFQQSRWMLKEIDRKRDWQPYNWLRRLREFSTDRSLSDDMRPWEYKSIHDILTPHQGRSNPSPKGNDIRHIELFNWDRKIKVEIPDLSAADTVVRYATLTPTSTPTIVSDFLDAVTGQYDFFLFYYVLKAGTDQTTGEVLIADNGSNVSMDHEWNTLGNDIDVTFTVANVGGVRKFLYTNTSIETVEMTFFVQAKWSI